MKYSIRPSGLKAVMGCPGSAKAAHGLARKGSGFANEGTCAHAIGANCLLAQQDASVYRGMYGYILSREVGFTDRALVPIDAEYVVEVTSDMTDAVQVYLDTVRGLLQHKDVLLVEQAVDLSEFVPGLVGTADCIIYRPSTGELIVIDYKHGAGVAVEVASGGWGNPQLLGYALGATQLFKGKPLTNVCAIVVQPRATHRDGPVRSYTLDALDLIEWSGILTAACELAQTEGAPRHAGKHCRWCPAAAICSENAQYSLRDPEAAFESGALVPVEGGAPVVPLTSVELGSLLRRAEDFAERFTSWHAQLKDYAKLEAEAGRSPDGWTLAAKRAQRKWIVDPIADLVQSGCPRHALFEPPMPLSPAKMEKVLVKLGWKKDTAAQRVGLLAHAESTGVVLVPADSKRALARTEEPAFSEGVL